MKRKLRIIGLTIKEHFINNVFTWREQEREFRRRKIVTFCIFIIIMVVIMIIAALVQN